MNAPNVSLASLDHDFGQGRSKTGLDISQEELAHRAGLHRTHLGFIERSERNITVLNLIGVCTALGVDPGEVVKGLRVDRKEE
jgi:transcriptional regulator with XRE-family HTH domain